MESKFSEKTVGTVIAVKRLWQIKINTKPVRSHSLDGAVFPHIITVKYTAGGAEYIKKKFVRARLAPPRFGETVDVYFREEKPSKYQIKVKLPVSSEFQKVSTVAKRRSTGSLSAAEGAKRPEQR